MGHCVEFLAALRRNGWPNIFRDRSGKARRSAYPNLYFCNGGTNIACFGDDNRGPMGGRGHALGVRDTASVLAAEFRDTRLQWWANRLPPGGDLTLVFHDTDLPEKPPDDWPNCMAFSRAGRCCGQDEAVLYDP